MGIHRQTMVAAVLLLCAGCGEIRAPIPPSRQPEPPGRQPEPWDIIAFTGNTPGEYNVTLMADPACDLPDLARQRTYAATIFRDPWDYALDGKFSGVKIRPELYWDFWILPGFSEASVFIGDYYNNRGIMDDSGGGLVLMLGKAQVVRVGSAISGPLSGTFGYCDRPKAGGESLEKACQVTPIYCDSERHLVILERRGA